MMPKIKTLAYCAFLLFSFSYTLAGCAPEKPFSSGGVGGGVDAPAAPAVSHGEATAPDPDAPYATATGTPPGTATHFSGVGYVQ